MNQCDYTFKYRPQKKALLNSCWRELTETHIPESLSAMTLLLHHTGQTTQSYITVHIYQASSDLTREGDNTFISIPCHLTMWHLPLWRYSSIVAVAQMWNSSFYHPVLGKEERSGRWRKWFLFNLDPPKWKETACWQVCERSTAGATGEHQRPV